MITLLWYRRWQIGFCASILISTLLIVIHIINGNLLQPQRLANVHMILLIWFIWANLRYLLLIKVWCWRANSQRVSTTAQEALKWRLVHRRSLPSGSESLSARAGMRTRICRWSLWTTSCSLPRDFSISLPASLRERFSVTVPLI